jgi:hypothetical protein
MLIKIILNYIKIIKEILFFNIYNRILKNTKEYLI